MRRLFVVAVLLALHAHGHEGWGIVVHDRLGVVVADIPGNSIWRITDGRTELLAANIHSHALVIGRDNAIYGSNPEPSGALSSVWRIDPSGRFSYVMPPAAGSPLGLQSFLITKDRSIYSANRYDHRRPTIVLLRRKPTGEIASATKGAVQFTGIDALQEAPNGTLVVADGAQLRSVRPDGDVSTLTPPLTTRRWDEDLLGLSSIRDDIVYVADHAGRRVLRVNVKNGQTEEVVKTGMFWAPAGVEHHQSLYVLEHLRPPLSIFGDLQLGPYLRVRRVAPDGTSDTLTVLWGGRTAVAAVLFAALVLMVIRLLRRLRPHTHAMHPQ